MFSFITFQLTIFCGFAFNILPQSVYECLSQSFHADHIKGDLITQSLLRPLSLKYMFSLSYLNRNVGKCCGFDCCEGRQCPLEGSVTLFREQPHVYTLMHLLPVKPIMVFTAGPNWARKAQTQSYIV